MPEYPKITPTMTVREVITAYPNAVKVFNKYGLTGCGGRLGPIEPVGFFASVHQADPDELLRELNALADSEDGNSPAAAEDTKPQPDIYRAFVKTAIGIALTVGCTLGAINLAAMALGNSVATPWTAITQAHGQAQIFGWVGLFIMGIAYHVLPRLKATDLQARPFAMASFWLVLGGLALRMIAQPLATNALFADLVVLSAVLEVVGASFFVYVCLATYAAAVNPRDFYDKYIIASAAWFLILALSTLGISIYTASRGLDTIPAAIDNPYLHVGLMGFVVMMIFGFTLRTVPLFMGLKTPNKKAFDLLFWPLNVAIAVTAISMYAVSTTNNPVALLVFQAASVVEYVGLIAFVYFLNIFRKPEVDIAESGADQGYEKYIRVAYAWLVISATMAFSYVVYRAIAGTDIDHAYVGAYRHALTVGFISVMILGMASRIIPVFTGSKLYSSTLLLATFVLINVGNTLRVLSQPLADQFGGPFFVTMGVSGFIEVTALALFAYNIWRTVDNVAEDETEPATETGTTLAAEPSAPPANGGDAAIKIELPVTRQHKVGAIIDSYPKALDVFLKHGFDHLRDENLRNTMAKNVTLDMVSQIHSVDLESLIAELNEVCQAEDAARRSLVA